MKKLLLLFALFIVTATSAQAAPAGVRLKYDLTVWDVSIGTMRIDIVRDLQTYKMTMSGGFGGIAALFSTGDGTMNANGLIEKGKIVPLYMHQNVAWDDEPRTIEIKFKNGTATDYIIMPPYNFNPDNRHALDPSTLHDVRDPLSATVQLHNPNISVCSHEARVFDGRERYDLQMVPNPENPWHCRVTPKLISGYKKKHDYPKDAPKTFDMYFTTVMDDMFLIPKLTVRPMSVGTVKIKLKSVTPLVF